MCLIIQRPANKVLDFEKFKTAVENNPDGYGISVANGNGELLTARDYRKPNVDQLYRFVQEELKDKQILLHLRYTTVGKTNLRNAHPFPVLELGEDGADVRMAHNGTLTAYKGNTDESDSRRFVRGFVRPLFKRLVKGHTVEEILKDPFTEFLLESQINSTSVLCFMDGDGNTLNVNAKGNGGFFEDGVFYSNEYSFDPKHRLPISYYTGYDSDWNYYKGSSSSTSNVIPHVNKEHAKDTMTQRFSEKYQLTRFDEVLSLDDTTIEELVTSHPGDAKLLIKELLDEYYQLNRKLENV